MIMKLFNNLVYNILKNDCEALSSAAVCCMGILSFDLHGLVNLVGLLLHKHVLVAFFQPLALHTIYLSAEVHTVRAGFFVVHFQSLLILFSDI